MSQWIEEGQQAPDFTLAADRRREDQAFGPAGQAGDPLLLSERRYARLHARSVFVSRPHQGTEKIGCRGAGGQRRHGGEPREVPRQVQVELSAFGGRRSQGRRKIRRWREKNMYGKMSMGIVRSTFLIDAQGCVAKLWKAVRVDGHDEQVIEALEGINVAKRSKEISFRNAPAAGSGRQRPVR